MQFIKRPSPNFDDRPEGVPADILLLHYTGMQTGEEAIARLCDAEAKVSSHYAVDEDGSTFQLVDESKRAWHAGVSSWLGVTDINARSIGIEIVNPGHEFGYRAFPEAQMLQVIALCKDILSRHDIPAARVLGHSDVAPKRKEDPGELFDWSRLATEGIGEFLDSEQGGTLDMLPMADLQRQFRQFGYGIEITGEYDDQTCKVIEAFQRHYRPRRVDGTLDAETCRLLTAYLEARGLT